jgi:hypothetical protein
MACCGQNRQALHQTGPRAANPPRVAGASYPTVPATPSPLPSAVFEYTGDRVLTVVGQGTGFPYRFTGRGARFTVDGRDRASLAKVPQLREVTRGT